MNSQQLIAADLNLQTRKAAVVTAGLAFIALADLVHTRVDQTNPLNVPLSDAVADQIFNAYVADYVTRRAALLAAVNALP